MKRTIFITLVVLTVNLTSFAQVQFPKGCYMSFEEIQSREPSQDFNVKIAKRKKMEIKTSDGNDFKITPKDKKVKKNTLMKDVWAVSDGENLYLNGIHYHVEHWYAMVDKEEDNKLYLSAAKNTLKPSVSVNGVNLSGGFGFSPVRINYYLDLNSNELEEIKE